MWVRGLLRAVSIVAATALSRAAALRPRVLGTTLATAAAARNRHTPHVRGGVLPRRRVQDTCPADDCCPAKLEPIPASECPPPDSGDVARFSCDAPDLVEGNLCRSNAGECGTDKNLDNCEYPETKLKADIYRVVEARPVAPSPKPTSICPELIPLEKDSPDCPDELDIAPCDTPGLTGFCEGDGECGTSKKLDNCACAGCGKDGAPITGADIYRIVDNSPTPRPTKKPSPPKPTTSPDDCPSLEALPKDSPDCPAELDIVPCDTPGLVAGDFCEGDGECGTDKKLDNCACEACGKGGAPISGADIYRVAGAPVADDDEAPVDDDAPVADDPEPGTDDDDEAPVADDDDAPVDEDDDGTPVADDDDDAPVDDDDSAPMDDNAAPTDEDDAGPADDDIIADDPDPIADDPAAVAVDTVLRFRPEELPAGYDRRMTVKRAVTESLVETVVPSEDDVLGIEWEPVEDLPAGRRRLADSAPCRATLRVFGDEADAVAGVAERVEAAAKSGALGEALANSEVPALGAAFDADATAANAAADTAISDPDGGAAPTPRPTSSPGGSKKKKKKSGHAFPIWAIIVIIVGGVGCCVCLFAAASGLATGGAKKQKPRASSYKLEAGKRPPPPDSDSDSEKPAAAVSRALEKLDDEEEGPPAYDFTPDKAKPAKHRSSVEVDELWPAAGVAGAGAAAAANESKAADGDMDCDSDSDLGSRISLHAPM